MKLIKVKCKDANQKLQQEYEKTFENLVINGQKAKKEDNSQGMKTSLIDFVWRFPKITLWTRKYGYNDTIDVGYTKKRGSFESLNSGVNAYEFKSVSSAKSYLLKLGKEISDKKNT